MKIFLIFYSVKIDAKNEVASLPRSALHILLEFIKFSNGDCPKTIEHVQGIKSSGINEFQFYVVPSSIIN